MKSHILDIKKHDRTSDFPGEVLTLKPFVDYLRKAKETATPYKQRVLESVIKKCEAHPEVEGPIDLKAIGNYTDLLQLIYATTSPILEEEQLHYWALSMPVTPVFFYYTDAFFDALADAGTGTGKKNIASLNEEAMNRSHMESCYAMILQRCYNIDSIFVPELIYPFEEEGTGFTRYFRISSDDRFIQIYPNGPLPPFSLESNNYDKQQLLAVLQEKLPLNKFRYEGICAMTVSDVTPHYAVENIKKSLLNRSSTLNEEYYPDVVKSLKTLARSKDIEFGLFPLLKVNNQYIFNKQTCVNSLLVNMFEQQGFEKEAYYFFGENYLLDPKLIFLHEIPPADAGNFVCANTLNKESIKSYALVPVYFNSVLCGVLEIYAREENLLKEDVLARLDPALPFIAQIFEKIIDDFDSEIESVVKNNFTSVQPSVQWKFKEAAWHYLRDTYRHKNHQEIETITFEKVYPLYGAVDLRNSTIERNKALRKDLQVQFDILISVLSELKEKSGFGLIDEKIFSCKKWLDKIIHPDGFNQETQVNEFLENEIMTFLDDFKTGYTSYEAITDRYFKAIDEKDGTANESRRQLEFSMNTIIAAVNNYMEQMKEEMQKGYPCYFEKFRTDGVEYDAYIGQSMAPERPFKDIYLNNLRLMQLTSMAAIAKHSHSMLAQLKQPIETTQLIFIHSHPIDIRFRKDEKRFDVEGAYNIRYQIVKKRIDKVHIKGTKDRLTVPNKIALAYFSQKEADEYAGYIRYLQEKGILSDDLEYLELEQLQGISGLKAMRVGVILE